MVEQMPALCKAIGLAILLAFIRATFDNMPGIWRRIVESLFCGAITWTLFYGVRAVGLNNYEDYAVFGGGCVGVFGSAFVRGLGRKIAAARIK